jgi:hypothetical protein
VVRSFGATPPNFVAVDWPSVGSLRHVVNAANGIADGAIR